MATKKFHICISVMSLVFGMMLIGCDNGNTNINEFTVSTDETISNDAATLGLVGETASSDKPNVAAVEITVVNKIKITSVSEGAAVITVSDDANHSATINVTVSKSGTISIGSIIKYTDSNGNYSVIFDSNGGSDVQKIDNLTSGSTISLPTAPTKEYYEFEGWYLDNETFNNKFEETSEITQNITLFAKWITPPEIGIQIYDEDGTPSAENGVPFIVQYYEDIGTVINGKMTLNLPESIPEDELGNLSYLGNRAGITVSDKNIKTLGIELTEMLGLYYGESGSNDRGYLLFWAGAPEEDDDIVEYIGYIYVSDDVSITGETASGGQTSKFDIHAKKGWNKVFRRVSEVSDFYTTDLSQAPSGCKWMVGEYYNNWYFGGGGGGAPNGPKDY